MFLKNILKKLKVFGTKFWSQWKHRKSSYQVRKTLVLFRNLVPLILGENSVNNLRVMKIDNGSKFEKIWGVLSLRKGLKTQSFTRYLILILVFMWNSALPDNYFLFFKRFLLVLRKISFWQGDCPLFYHYIRILGSLRSHRNLGSFLIFLNFLRS